MAPQQRKRATIREVAEATGLSPAAVSYALRGIQTSAETQERVRRAAAELGYNVDRIARALASGRTGTVGLLFGSLEDLWQQLLGVGLGSALLARDNYALLVDAAGDPERQLRLAAQLRDQRVDGLIVQPLDPSDERWEELAQSLPIVSIGDALPGGGAAGEVLFDNRAGVALALAHLHKLGHRRIGVLTPTQPSTPDRPADIQVTAEAERLGLDVSIISSPPVLAEATEVAREVLTQDRPAHRAVLLRRLHRLRRLRGGPRARPAHPRRAVGLRLRRAPDVRAADPGAHDHGLERRPDRPGRGPDDPVRDRAEALPPPHGPAPAAVRARLHRPAGSPFLTGRDSRPAAHWNTF